MAAKTIASLAIAIGVDLSGFEKDMKEFRKTWGTVGKQMQEQGMKVGTAFTAAGGAIAAGLGFAVSKAMDFDAQMSRVGAISDATNEEFKALRDTALDLGASTSKSAGEVAVGMELMAAMGFEATEVIAAMPGVISAAEASGEDMALVSETVAAALNAWGMEAGDASKVADVLAMSANKSAAGIGDLQYAFKYAAPLAKQLGVGIEELAAATGIMVDAGMKGEQAGTSLRMAFTRLAKPPKEAAKQIAALGLQVTDTEGNMLPFADIVGQLKTSLEGMGSAQRTAALAQIFGAEAASGMLNIIDAGPEKLRQLTTELQNSGGASQETANKMKDNLKGSMEELSGAVETLQISMGSALAPAIRSVADGLSSVVNWFNSLSPETQKFIAIGAAVTAVLFLIVGALGFLAVALGAVATAQWAAMVPLLMWIGIGVLVIAAVAAIAYFVYKYWDEIKAITIAVWEAVKNAVTAAWDWIVNIFRTAWSVVGPIIMAYWEAVMAVWTAAFETIKALLTAWWDTIKTIFATAFLAIVYLVTGQWGKLGELFAAARDKLVGVIRNLWSTIGEIWSSASDKIIDAVARLWGGVRSAFLAGWEKLKNWLSFLREEAKSIGVDMMRGMIEGIKNMASSIASAAKEVVKSAIDAAKSFLKIGSPSKLFAQFGEWTGEGFAIGLESTSDIVAGAGAVMAAPAVQAVQSLPDVSSEGVASGTSQPMVIIQELDGRVVSRTVLDYMGGTFRIRGAVT